MNKPAVLLLASPLDGMEARLRDEFTDFEFLDGRTPEGLGRGLPRATITYGIPPVGRIPEAADLKWIQLISAGVPADLCPVAVERDLVVTNLAGLYGPTIAEHALGMMLILARGLHRMLRNQDKQQWDRTVADDIRDLHGRTLAVVGLGNIGRSIARLGAAFGMRVVGCRRTTCATPHVDRVYPREELHAMLSEADIVAVAAPLTVETKEMLGKDEFAAMKPGVHYINVSRGPIAEEGSLLKALDSGHVAAAGLDVFAVEPLQSGHPLWSHPQVFVSPHVSGETINRSGTPAERFARNLRAWRAGQPLEGVVEPRRGY